MAFLTFIFGFIYRLIWLEYFRLKKVPTGFGIFLIFGLLLISVGVGLASEYSLIFLSIFLSSCLYWIDDAYEMRAIIRILISFFSGAIICFLVLNLYNPVNFILILISCLLVGFLNIILTNVINFYDGEDLNIATLIFLIMVTNLFYNSSTSIWFTFSIYCLAFILPFGVMNSKPKYIYFGDTGCFVIACVITLWLILFLFKPNSIAIEFLVPMAFPLLDVVYVIILRILKKQNLMTRNYLHLYQCMRVRYGGYKYLFPQFANTAISLVLISLLGTLGFSKIVAFILVISCSTPVVYFGLRYWYVDSAKF